MMVGAPAQQPVADQHDHPVGEIARDADHDHAADHQLGARQGAAVHDDGAQALRHAGHLADHDDEPGEAQPQSQAGEDGGRRGRQHDLVELRVAAAAQHRGRLEQFGIDRAHAEDGVEQDRIEGAEADQREGRLGAQPEQDHRQRQPGRDGDRPHQLQEGIEQHARRRHAADHQAER
jgi:hypothetical protein